MHSSAKLTLALIDRRPDAAAQVLASISGEDAAAFMNSIPTRYARAALMALNASACAAIIRHMDVTSASAVIRDMEFGASAAVLRQLQPAQRQALLQGLPGGRKTAFEKSLAFPPDSVGAVMTTDIPLLFQSDEVKQGLVLLKKHTENSIDAIFVVDKKRQYMGTVHVLELLRHAPSTALESLLDDACPGVSANARLAQIEDLPAWQLHRQLPVLSRQGEVIGAIERKTYHQHSTVRLTDMDVERAPMSQLMLGTMADCGQGLVDLLTPDSTK